MTKPSWYNYDSQEKFIDGRRRSILPFLGPIFTGLAFAGVGAGVIIFQLVVGLPFSLGTPIPALFIIGALGIIGGFGLSVYEYLEYRVTYFLLTNQYIAKKTQLFGDERDPVHLSDVVDQGWEQSFLEQILNMGTVYVETAGDMGHGDGEADIKMKYVPDPQGFHDQIKHTSADYKPTGGGTNQPPANGGSGASPPPEHDNSADNSGSEPETQTQKNSGGAGSNASEDDGPYGTKGSGDRHYPDR